MQNLRNKAYQWLRGSEGFFQADMVYIAKGGFWVTFGQGIGGLLSLLLIIGFANLLPKETYGIYRYILSLAGILNIFTLVGMNQAVSRAVASGKEGVLRDSVKYQLKWNSLMLLAFWVLGFYYYTKGNSTLALSFVVLSFFLPLYQALGTYGAYLEGKRNFRLNNIYSTISTLIYVVGMLIAIILSGEVIWLVATYALTTTASSVIFYILTIKKFEPSSERDEETLKYGRELTFIGFIGIVASQIDKIVLTHYWGASQLAVYMLALAIPDRVAKFIKDWVNMGFPKFSSKNKSEINEVFYKRILQGLLLGAIISVAYIVISPFIFKYLIPQYMDSIFYSQILALGFVFAIPGRYVSLLLASQKLTKLMFFSNMTQSLLRISLYVLLGLTWGILGLAVAHVLLYILGLIMNVLLWNMHKEKE